MSTFSRETAGLKIAGFDSLEIRRDVRMRMQVDTDSLLPVAIKPGQLPMLRVGTSDHDACNERTNRAQAAG